MYVLPGAYFWIGGYGNECSLRLCGDGSTPSATTAHNRVTTFIINTDDCSQPRYDFYHQHRRLFTTALRLLSSTPTIKRATLCYTQKINTTFCDISVGRGRSWSAAKRSPRTARYRYFIALLSFESSRRCSSISARYHYE